MQKDDLQSGIQKLFVYRIWVRNHITLQIVVTLQLFHYSKALKLGLHSTLEFFLACARAKQKYSVDSLEPPNTNKNTIGIDLGLYQRNKTLLVKCTCIFGSSNTYIKLTLSFFHCLQKKLRSTRLTEIFFTCC